MNLDRELRDVLAERAERGQPPPPNIDALMAGGLTLRRRRRRVVVALSACAALVAIAAGLAVGQGLQDSRGADNPVDRPTPHVDRSIGVEAPPPYLLDVNTRERAPAPKGIVALEGGVGYFWGGILSPDGSKFAYSTCGNVCEPDDGLMVTDADGTDVVKLRAPQQQVDPARPDVWDLRVLAWSPDSTTLLYQALQSSTRDVGNLFIHDFDSGRTTQLTHLGRPPIQLGSAAWWALEGDFSSDGTRVLFHVPRTGSNCTEWDVWSVPVTGGDPTLVLRDAASPRHLADSERIAFLQPNACAFTGKAVWIAAGGSRRPLIHLDPVDPPDRLEMSPDRAKTMYTSAGEVFLVDVATGETTRIGDGNIAIWVDNDTLLMPGSDRPD